MIKAEKFKMNCIDDPDFHLHPRHQFLSIVKKVFNVNFETLSYFVKAEILYKIINLLAYLLLIDVKNHAYLEAAIGETLITGQSAADIPCPDDGDVPDSVDVEDFLDLIAQKCDVIPGALFPKFA